MLEIEKWSAPVKYRERCMGGVKEGKHLKNNVNYSGLSAVNNTLGIFCPSDKSLDQFVLPSHCHRFPLPDH